MKRRLLEQGLVVLAALAWLSPLAAQTYRPDYPQTLSAPADPQPPVTNHSDVEQIQHNYEASRQPSVLLLLGRTLGADTSQWQADQRDVTSNLQQSFQGGASSTSRQTGVRQTEQRIAISANVTPALQEFYRGFERFFGQVGIRTLNYDAALRRAQQENELQGRLSREGDLRKNEADAVLTYAELMLEMTSTGLVQIAGVDVESFQVRLTRIDRNEVIARYTTLPDEAAIIEEGWQAGSNGYEPVTDVILRYQALGQEVAYRLFAQAFSQPLQIISGSRRMQPIRRPPTNPNAPRPPRRNGDG